MTALILRPGNSFASDRSLAYLSADADSPCKNSPSRICLLAIFLCAIVRTMSRFILTGVIVHLSGIHPVPALVAGLSGALLHDSIWSGSATGVPIRSRPTVSIAGSGRPSSASPPFGPWECCSAVSFTARAPPPRASFSGECSVFP